MSGGISFEFGKFLTTNLTLSLGEIFMKVELYNYIRAAQKMNRRQLLKGMTAAGAAAMMPKLALSLIHI